MAALLSFRLAGSIRVGRQLWLDMINLICKLSGLPATLAGHVESDTRQAWLSGEMLESKVGRPAMNETRCFLTSALTTDMFSNRHDARFCFCFYIENYKQRLRKGMLESLFGSPAMNET